eukprot:860369-Pleurochrysis_carterae.AAC.2
MVPWTPDDARNSVNSEERNSPALSLCYVPITWRCVPERLLSSALKEAIKRRTCAGASDLHFKKCTALKRV